MNTETRLKEISDSLPKPKTVRRSFDSLRAKIVNLRQADPSLVNLQLLCDELLVFIDEQQREKDLAARLDGFAVDMNLLNNRLEANLKKIGDVQEGLQEKINRFNLLEAKYSRMITRVNSVLDELEKVLRTI